MKGIASCEDCPINITIYRFTGNQGIFSVPKKWCQECDLLVEEVEQTMLRLGIESQVNLRIKPWLLWFWQPLLTNLAWHAPILIINGKLVSQGIVPNRKTLIKTFTEELNADKLGSLP